MEEFAKRGIVVVMALVAVFAIGTAPDVPSVREAEASFVPAPASVAESGSGSSNLYSWVEMTDWLGQCVHVSCGNSEYCCWTGPAPE